MDNSRIKCALHLILQKKLQSIPLVLMANRALSETGPSASGGFTICFQMFPDHSFFEDKGKAGTYQMIYILCIEYNVLLLYYC